MPADNSNDSVRLVCPRCRSRLEVLETASGGRTVSVLGLGESVDRNPRSLEVFIAPDAGPDISCPACSNQFDPAGPYRGISRQRDEAR